MLLNITQFIFHANFKKINLCQTRHRLDFCTFRVTVKHFVLRKLPEVQREFIRTQHLHVVASSIAKLPDDAFVSAATADACSMVNLFCLFMKPHPLGLL